MSETMPIPEFIPVSEATSISELSKSMLERTIDLIVERQKSGAPSYGAMILRGATSKIAMSVMDQYLNLVRDDNLYELNRYALEINSANNNKGFHIDYADYGTPNDVTAHLTTKGTAHVIIAPSLAHEYFDSIGALRQEFKKPMQTNFDNGFVPPDSLCGTLNAGDLLIFDHTLPHIFVGNSDRVSTAHFADLIPLKQAPPQTT